MKKLDFEYCECGCHGFELSVAGQYFWVNDDLKGNYDVHSGHGWISHRLIRLKSWDEVRAYVRGKLEDAAKELKDALE